MGFSFIQCLDCTLLARRLRSVHLGLGGLNLRIISGLQFDFWMNQFQLRVWATNRKGYGTSFPTNPSRHIVWLGQCLLFVMTSLSCCGRVVDLYVGCDSWYKKVGGVHNISSHCILPYIYEGSYQMICNTSPMISGAWSSAILELECQSSWPSAIRKVLCWTVVAICQKGRSVWLLTS